LCKQNIAGANHPEHAFGKGLLAALKHLLSMAMDID